MTRSLWKVRFATFPPLYGTFPHRRAAGTRVATRFDERSHPTGSYAICPPTFPVVVQFRSGGPAPNRTESLG